MQNTLIRRTLIFALACFLGSCSSTPPSPETVLPEGESTSQAINELLAMANSNNSVDAANSHLLAIKLMLEEGYTSRAIQEVRRLTQRQQLSAAQKERLVILQARIAISQNDPFTALARLTDSSPPVGSPSHEYTQLLGDTYLLAQRPIDAFLTYASATESLPPEEKQNLFDSMWASLTLLDDTELSYLASTASGYETRGWVELARIVSGQRLSIKGQLDAIEQWRRVWSSHQAASALPIPLMRLRQVWENRPRQLAFLLPLQDVAGRAIQEGLLSAYYQSIELTRDAPEIRFYDSSNSTNIYPLYDSAVEDGADIIIGPLSKQLVNQLQRLSNLPVPTLALNYTDNDSSANPENFFQFGLAPENEIQQAAQFAAKSGFKNAAIITPSGAEYERLRALFNAAWAKVGGNVVSTSVFDEESDYAEIIKQSMAIDASESRAAKLRSLLPRDQIVFTPRRRGDIDFIYLIANPRQGRQIHPTLAFYFAESLPVVAYPSIYDGSANTGANKDLDGIVFLDAPWLLDSDNSLKNTVSSNLRQSSGPIERLRAMGIDSYRLHDRLPQFTQSEISQLEGTTGTLTMTSKREIQRHLPIAKFSNGLPVLLPFPETKQKQ